MVPLLSPLRRILLAPSGETRLQGGKVARRSGARRTEDDLQQEGSPQTASSGLRWLTTLVDRTGLPICSLTPGAIRDPAA
ncbi:hypothetical protein NDU88_000779 [Pleurodeles waltl]|uniref:Uncharacterized protein n=1 Tax=Pleurodeles waltl TaxID=8319 RepID=A0AAV7UQZ5_PLEWA|nr:hypothetical protein NDU88_000779 [Pleurodeles waltl]